MTFREEELLRLKKKILLVTIRSTNQSVKGRLVDWDGEFLTLAGDAEVANILEPPDDVAAPDTIQRLAPGQTQKVRLKDLADARWTGM